MWKKGQSGNPAGNVKGAYSRARLAKQLMSPHVKEAIAEIVRQLESDDNKDRQWAAKMIVEYSLGKPSQIIEIDEEGGNVQIMPVINILPSAK